MQISFLDALAKSKKEKQIFSPKWKNTFNDSPQFEIVLEDDTSRLANSLWKQACEETARISNNQLIESSFSVASLEYDRIIQGFSEEADIVNNEPIQNQNFTSATAINDLLATHQLRYLMGLGTQQYENSNSNNVLPTNDHNEKKNLLSKCTRTFSQQFSSFTTLDRPSINEDENEDSKTDLELFSRVPLSSSKDINVYDAEYKMNSDLFPSNTASTLATSAALDDLINSQELSQPKKYKYSQNSLESKPVLSKKSLFTPSKNNSSLNLVENILIDSQQTACLPLKRFNSSNFYRKRLRSSDFRPVHNSEKELKEKVTCKVVEENKVKSDFNDNSINKTTYRSLLLHLYKPTTPAVTSSLPLDEKMTKPVYIMRNSLVKHAPVIIKNMSSSFVNRSFPSNKTALLKRSTYPITSSYVPKDNLSSCPKSPNSETLSKRKNSHYSSCATKLLHESFNSLSPKSKQSPTTNVSKNNISNVKSDSLKFYKEFLCNIVYTPEAFTFTPNENGNNRGSYNNVNVSPHTIPFNSNSLAFTQGISVEPVHAKTSVAASKH